MRITSTLLILLAVLVLNGCSGQSESVKSGSAPASAQPAPAAAASDASSLEKLIVASEPGPATGVVEAKEKVKDGEEVTVKGRVKEFVKGYAVFTIADTGMKACIDNPDETCKTPWDYCCNPPDKIKKSVATVQLSNDGTAPIKAELEGFRGLQKLSSYVTVSGIAKRDEAGNLTIIASKLFIKTS